MALTEGQQRCVDTLDRPLVVAAGAGSGKTFTLTKRIVHALETGQVEDIDEVCAITFTKKAAGELKSRIKSELRSCGLVSQALKVDEAWISTIHGMCARILRSHAIELGIDPAFKVGEGADIQAYLDRAVDSVLARQQGEANSSGVDALFREYSVRSAGYGASVEDMLLALVETAAAQPDGIDGLVMPGVVVSPHVAFEAAIDAVQALWDVAQGEKAGKSHDEWVARVEGQLACAREVLMQGDASPLAMLESLAPIKLSKQFGSADYKALVDETKGVFGSCVMEIRLGLAQGHLETLVGLARLALDEFSRLKQADGVLDNNDLLVMAARAIEEHPSIRARYADKFKLVMVDEFQDTDQMQVDMIRRIAGEGGCRLCVVGDAQQSIYRFRGADVSVYRRHLNEVRESWDDSVIELSQNFRSHADVLAFVDRVFEKPDMFGGEFMSLSAGRLEESVKAPFEDDRPRVLVQHTVKPYRGVSSDDACAAAAQRVAEEFAALVEAGHSPGEMVVLLGRMKNAPVFASAIRAQGLPCVISGGSVFAQSTEAGVVADLLRVIANPNETQSLFNVLTSPLFGLVADDLLAVDGLKGFWKAAGEVVAGEHAASGAAGAAAGGAASGAAGDAADGAAGSAAGDAAGGAAVSAAGGEGQFANGRLKGALRVMGRLRRKAGRYSVARIVEDAAVESGWLTRLQGQGAEGLADAGNLFKAIRMVSAIEKSGAYGPVSVMRRYEEALASSKEAPGALSVSGGNSVRIMTIHASKGLEFPIVAVAEMKESRASSAGLLVSTVGGRVYVSLDLGRSVPSGATPVDLDVVRDYVLGEVAGEDELARAVQEEAGALHRRLALRDYAATGDAEEAKRLLYVALTRAKEALIVSTVGTSTSKNAAGVPKSAFAGVFAALEGGGACLDVGRSSADYGGSLPAVFDCRSLAPNDAAAGDDAHADADGGEGSPGARADAGAPFEVPAPLPEDVFERDVYKPLRENVFSYSSVAEASHATDVLDRLAASFALSVDASPASGEAGEPGDGPGRSRAVVFEDDFWDFDVSQLFDEDRATDLGTAFHRLAQYAVAARGDGALELPPAERVAALSRTCNLGGDQRARLAAALNRWFSCDVAHEIAQCAALDAEVPFYVAVPGLAGETTYLEGEIDLLGLNDDGSCARVVDYKTGGRDDETPEELCTKHVLQASCYAYALLLHGVQTVQADFVRVERPRADDPSQPQCVRYRFGHEDLPALEQAIAQAYAAAKA